MDWVEIPETNSEGPETPETSMDPKETSFSDTDPSPETDNASDCPETDWVGGFKSFIVRHSKIGALGFHRKGHHRIQGIQSFLW